MSKESRSYVFITAIHYLPRLAQWIASNLMTRARQVIRKATVDGRMIVLLNKILQADQSSTHSPVLRPVENGWETKLPTTINATPDIYRIDSRRLVAIDAGEDGSAGLSPARKALRLH